MNQQGDPYALSKKAAGEAYRAAKKVKLPGATVWRRSKKKGTK
jgi:hypothetical protein